MKNTLADLNNHLFAEMERISDEDLKGDELEMEIRRAGAVCGIAMQIIQNGELALKAEKFIDEAMSANTRLPKFLRGSNAEDAQLDG